MGRNIYERIKKNVEKEKALYIRLRLLRLMKAFALLISTCFAMTGFKGFKEHPVNAFFSQADGPELNDFWSNFKRAPQMDPYFKSFQNKRYFDQFAAEE